MFTVLRVEEHQMPRQQLKQKLKAADRRRKRRSPGTAEKDFPTQRRSIDVSGLIVSAILEHVHTSRSEVRDATVISAMRNCLKGGPLGQPSLLMVERLERIGERTDVDPIAFRDALQQMLKLAYQFRDSKDSTAFVQYLGIVAG